MTALNEGRPSKLELDRYATGELSEEEVSALEARLDDRARAHLAALEQVRSEVPPLDLAALRARAAALTDPVEALISEPAPEQPPANNARGWRWLGPSLLSLAAAAALWLGVARLTGPEPEILIPRTSGGALVVHQAVGGRLSEYAPGTPVGEGDVLGFQVDATGHRGVVVLSVDGTGAVSMFFPDSGPDPLPLQGQGLIPIDGTVILDGAPGPEIFLALFDTSPQDATTLVQRTFSAGGHEGLLELARSSAKIDAVEVSRR